MSPVVAPSRLAPARLAAGRVLLVGYLLAGAGQVSTEAARTAGITGSGWPLAGTILISLLMPLLAAHLIVRIGLRARLARWTLAGLGFSWLGDSLGFLGLPVLIAFFAVAQICYLVAFWPYRTDSVIRRSVALTGVLVALVALAISLVAVNSGLLAIGVIGYGVLLGLMALLATGVDRLAGIGGWLFVISDLTLAADRLVPGFAFPASGAVVMVSYVTAQLLLVRGVVHRVESQDLAKP